MVMKLGGWLRIGVVLSVLWIIGVWTYALHRASPEPERLRRAAALGRGRRQQPF
jgi:hypothetical protein